MGAKVKLIIQDKNKKEIINDDNFQEDGLYGNEYKFGRLIGTENYDIEVTRVDDVVEVKLTDKKVDFNPKPLGIWTQIS